MKHLLVIYSLFAKVHDNFADHVGKRESDVIQGTANIHIWNGQTALIIPIFLYSEKISPFHLHLSASIEFAPLGPLGSRLVVTVEKEKRDMRMLLLDKGIAIDVSDTSP